MLFHSYPNDDRIFDGKKLRGVGSIPMRFRIFIRGWSADFGAIFPPID